MRLLPLVATALPLNPLRTACLSPFPQQVSAGPRASVWFTSGVTVFSSLRLILFVLLVLLTLAPPAALRTCAPAYGLQPESAVTLLVTSQNG